MAFFNGVELDRFASPSFALSRVLLDIIFGADFSTCNPRTGCIFSVVGALVESTILDDNSVLLHANKAGNPIIKEQHSDMTLKWLRQFLNGLCRGVKVFTNLIIYIILHRITGVFVGLVLKAVPIPAVVFQRQV